MKRLYKVLPIFKLIYLVVLQVFWVKTQLNKSLTKINEVPLSLGQHLCALSCWSLTSPELDQ